MAMSSDILIIDDEDDIRGLIQGILEDEGFETREAATSDQAYQAVREKVPALVVLDIWLQGSKHDGLEILKTLKAEYPDLPFVMISGHGTIETAVSAIRDGAYDFIEKPFKSDRLLMMINRALETALLRRENAVLKKKTADRNDSLIGKSQAVQSIRDIIERVAPTNSRVLITGEAGTGKDVISRLIHNKSLRKDDVFMVLNCATLRPERLEVELFGAEASVNNGQEHTGILEHANGGTLLLDEVADMPLETQGKIVRVLQEQQFQKIGGQDVINADVRVLATTNKDLSAAIEAGDFREDLYYRLNVVRIEVPSLREHAEDIPELAEFFLRNILQNTSGQTKRFSNAALNVLKSYGWPGNVRQLKNVVESVCIIQGSSDVEIFSPEHLPPDLSPVSHNAQAFQEDGFVNDEYLELSLRDAREAFEREYLLSQVARFDGNISKTAQFVGMERSALHRKLKSLQINHDKDEKPENVTDINQKRA